MFRIALQWYSGYIPLYRVFKLLNRLFSVESRLQILQPFDAVKPFLGLLLPHFFRCMQSPIRACRKLSQIRRDHATNRRSSFDNPTAVMFSGYFQPE